MEMDIVAGGALQVGGGEAIVLSNVFTGIMGHSVLTFLLCCMLLFFDLCWKSSQDAI